MEKKFHLKSLTRANRVQISQTKGLIKDGLPVLSLDKVRRYKMSSWDAALLELEEGGSFEAVKSLERIRSLDDEQKNGKLRKQSELIDRLKDCFQSVESAKQANKLSEATSTLLQNAVFFHSLSDFTWIADELINQCLSTAGDNKESLNIIKFISAEFLFKEKNYKEAAKCLEEIRSVSELKKWRISKLLRERRNSNLFRECNILLYKIHLILGEQVEADDVEVAADHYEEALHRAVDADYDDHIAKALYKLGMLELERKNFSRALKLFSKFLSKVKRRSSDCESVCLAHKQLALIHLALKNDKGVRRHLELFRTTANEFGLLECFADANLDSGKYFLSKRKKELASHFFKYSAEIYKSLGLKDEMDQSIKLLMSVQEIV